MPFTEPSPFGDVLFAFLSILLEGAPFILLGTLISGFIDAYLPAGAIGRALPRSAGLAILASGLLGVVFPVCECAVIPVVRRLVQKGLPISCGITYLLAAPVINPVVILSTYSAFQMGMPGFSSEAEYAGFMTISRLTMAFLVAVFVGFVTLRVPRRAILRTDVEEELSRSLAEMREERHDHDHSHDHDHDGDEHDHGHGHGGDGRLVHALRTAMRDFLDVGMYFTIGVAITAVFNTQFDQEMLEPLAVNNLLAIPTLMLLSFVLSLCSTSDAFIAAPMTAFSHAAKLAFLVFGPMMDLKLVFMYQSVFRKAFIWKMVLGLFLLVGVVALAWTRTMALLG